MPDAHEYNTDDRFDYQLYLRELDYHTHTRTAESRNQRVEHHIVNQARAPFALSNAGGVGGHPFSYAPVALVLTGQWYGGRKEREEMLKVGVERLQRVIDGPSMSMSMSTGVEGESDGLGGRGGRGGMGGLGGRKLDGRGGGGGGRGGRNQLEERTEEQIQGGRGGGGREEQIQEGPEGQDEQGREARGGQSQVVENQRGRGGRGRGKGKGRGDRGGKGGKR